MENIGEAADDQGSGWFEVKKVVFFVISLFGYMSHNLVFNNRLMFNC